MPMPHTPPQYTVAVKRGKCEDTMDVYLADESDRTLYQNNLQRAKDFVLKQPPAGLKDMTRDAGLWALSLEITTPDMERLISTRLEEFKTMRGAA